MYLLYHVIQVVLCIIVVPVLIGLPYILYKAAVSVWETKIEDDNVGYEKEQY